MSPTIRISSIALRGVLPFRYQYKQLLQNRQNDLLSSSKFTRTFFKERSSKQTAVLSENNPTEWMSSALPMRYVSVNTSQKRWEDIPDGFFFDAGYVDSHPDSVYNPNIPLVLAVHDMYGGHESLIPLLAPLVLKNYRVIALNLPSSNHTNGIGFGHDAGFLHSTDEYAEFIGDFMEELKIPKADLMLGYGTGCYPLLPICTKTDLCSSAALICPAGHVIHKGIQPFRFAEVFVESWESPFLHPYLKVIAFLFKYLSGRGQYTTEEVIQSLKVIRGIDFNNIGSYLFNLKLEKFPVGVLYSKNDKMVEAEVYEHFCQLLGLQEDQMTFYDKEAQITKQGTSNSKIQAIVLEERPNNVLQDFRLPMIKMIEKLIDSVHQRR